MDDAADEIERLREQVQYEQDRNANNVALADAEIERLREEVQLHVSVKDKLKEEIERLRKLLREGLDHHDEYNWQQRVREALGE